MIPKTMTLGISYAMHFDGQRCAVLNASGEIISATSSASIASAIHAATSKDTPIDADELALWDSVTATLNKLTWANLKAILKAYFDTLYLKLTGGNLTGALNEAKGNDIASNTTTDIGAATGNYVNVTGTTAITGLGTIQAGTRRIVTFSGILTLTHHATSLILPSAANITTAAGDCAEFVSLGSGNWKCTKYQKADGTAIVGGGGGGHTIQNEGSPLSARTYLNFTGDGVTASDDDENDATVVNISGGSGGGSFLVNQIFN